MEKNKSQATVVVDPILNRTLQVLLLTILIGFFGTLLFPLASVGNFEILGGNRSNQSVSNVLYIYFQTLLTTTLLSFVGLFYLLAQNSIVHIRILRAIGLVFLSMIVVDIKDRILFSENKNLLIDSEDVRLFFNSTTQNSFVCLIFGVVCLGIAFWRSSHIPFLNKRNTSNNNKQTQIIGIDEDEEEFQANVKIFLWFLVVVFGALTILFWIFPLWVVRDISPSFHIEKFNTNSKPIDQIIFIHFVGKWLFSTFVFHAAILLQFRQNAKNHNRILLCITINWILLVLVTIIHIYYFLPNQQLRQTNNNFSMWINRGLRYNALFHLVLAGASTATLMQKNDPKKKAKNNNNAPQGSEYLKLE